MISFGLEAAISNEEIGDDVLESCDFIHATLDEYAVYEVRYLAIDCTARETLQRCIFEVYKAIIVYAAEMRSYIDRRTGLYCN